MAYRRGFKTEAELIANEVREELGLSVMDPLDPLLLADHLAIPVIPLSELESLDDESTHYLLKIEPKSFSAVTVFSGRRRTIVHNDSHASTRQRSNVSHELGHGLLGHDPTAALDDRGCRLWDQAVEDEATFLGGALLIPRDACIALALKRKPLWWIAQEFGISEQMVRYRLAMTGATTIASRSRQRRGRRSS